MYVLTRTRQDTK